MQFFDARIFTSMVYRGSIDIFEVILVLIKHNDLSPKLSAVQTNYKSKWSGFESFINNDDSSLIEYSTIYWVKVQKHQIPLVLKDYNKIWIVT